MWFTTEPNGWMSYLNVCFSTEKAIEDDRVRAYLSERDLTPRRVLPQEEAEVWQFGECYLAPHMGPLRALYFQGLVGDYIVRALDKPLPQEQVWILAELVITNNAAVPDPQDSSKLLVDEAFLREQSAARA
jgi:hypothetical protein